MKSLIIGLITLIISTGTLIAQNNTLIKAFSESYALENKGEYSQAINALKKVYASESYETNLRLGWLHYMAGNFTEAIPFYQRCIELKPMSIEARLGFALPASALGNWDSILEQYFKILNIDPNHSLVNYRTGMIFYGRQQYQKAEPYFQKVVNLYPFDYDGLLMLGWTKYFLGNAVEAKVLFGKVLLYSPKDESALDGLGRIN